mmetsp:Transcript_76495/g.127482  ORF Transcript_76495/g.127482 Transcript_76495/m.127482 type:complete len:348 (+) Transcript_76495:185-1228(+)|eukprot:CAMPEP_0119305814 /NCGR_PEP_ID=MMETSP1333-20130426/6717_1 /TAXON_ID=418940 /ORGANISM="Scyphosphaera apsteinii, Strain RCC1455" /LENGTH=347 /DNA_ID=CAMNT_0007308993 /DNA_START=180 /DNA_END=1223 /DNA_ORIENTATION=+
MSISNDVPALQTGRLALSVNKQSDFAPPSPHKSSGRRLSKSVMLADSQDIAGSKRWGVVELSEPSGSSHSVRVVQTEESEDVNILRVTWFWTFEAQTFQVELRHGRRSGIRKIYVDRKMVDRVKTVKNLLSDTGSRHDFTVGKHDAEIIIVPKGVTGFHYQLKIDGNAIEQSVDGPMGAAALTLGTRCIALKKTADGLGMTLRNNPFGTGAVVWTVEEGKEAALAGLNVGDIVLSVETYLLESIDFLVEYVASATDVIHMELAGSTPSRVVTMVKRRDNPIGMSMQVTSCGVGILISEIDPQGIAAAAGLKVGDSILSVDDIVPNSPKHLASVINQCEYLLKFVIVS